MRQASAGFLILIFFVACAAAAAQPAGDLVDRIDAFVVAEMERQRAPGVAIGIAMKGEVVAAKGYGHANLEHRVPVTEQTLYQSGSVGKQFTAAAVMLQVEQGKLALDDTIARYFPDAPETWRSIRVRHLLTHTSGIADYGPDEIDYRRDYTEAELAQATYRLPLEFEPGSRWSYSNTGYALLGMIVRRVSGQFYGDVLKDRVFGPLGMRTARIINEADIIPNRAAGYHLVDGEVKNQEWVSPALNTTADGSLYLSILDYLAWDRGLRSGAVLKPESWSQVYAPARLESGKHYPYGFGWSVDEWNGHPWYHHGGSWQGFTTHISRYLANDLTIVVLTNLADASPERFVDGIAALIDPAIARLEPTTSIPDREPAVTARVAALLRASSQGQLKPDDLPFVRDGFAELAADYVQLLRSLGTPRLDLLERRELGDDLVYTYAAVYQERVLNVTFGLAPDDRISEFWIQPR